MPNRPQGTGLASAMQRLFEAQNRPQPTGLPSAEIDRILMAAMEEEERARALGGPGASAPFAEAGAVAPPEIALPGLPEGAQVQPFTGSMSDLVEGAEAPEELVREAQREERARQLAAQRRGEVLRTTPVSLENHPEMPYAPDDPRSAIGAAHTLPDLNYNVDSDGSFVVSHPGIQGQLRIPLNMHPAELERWLVSISNNWQGTTRFGENPTIARRQARQIFDAFIAAQDRLRGMRPRGPAGPLNEATLTYRQQIGAPVDPSLIAARDEATEARRQAQLTSDEAEAELLQKHGDNLMSVGEFQSQQATEQAREAVERYERLQEKLQAYEDAIRRVADRQVDPDRYFGRHAGGRMSAALAVALGAIGSSLTGGPNQALQIINSAIDRDIQAQEHDIQNARSAANMQGMALSQFRSILGDEEAAKAATRAAHLQSFLTRLDGQMAHAQGNRLAHLQALRRAVVEEMEAQNAIVAARSAYTLDIERSTTVKQRGGPGAGDAYRQAAEGTVASFQPREEGPLTPEEDAQIAAQEERELPTVLERVREGTLFEEGPPVELPLGESYVTVPSIAVAPTRQQEQVVRSARRRLERDPNDREARDTVAAGRRLARRQQRQTERRWRRILGEIPSLDHRDIDAISRSLDRRLRDGQEGGELPQEVLPRPFRWMRPSEGVENPVQLFRDMMAKGETARNRFLNAVNTYNVLVDIYPKIIAARQQWGRQIIPVSEQMETARALAMNFRSALQHARSGAQLSERELEFYEKLIPDPSKGWSIQIDTIIQAWNALLTTIARQARAELAAFGITIDSPAGNATLMRQALNRVQD